MVYSVNFPTFYYPAQSYIALLCTDSQ